jgi:hypothetical protein
MARCVQTKLTSRAAFSGRNYVSSIYHEAMGKTVFHGGRTNWGNGGTTYGNTYAWNGTILTEISGGPSARTKSGFLYDPDRQKGVLFAGYFQKRDLWELDALGAWTSRSVGSYPWADGSSSPAGHVWVYNPVVHKALFFGGFEAGTYRNVTCEVDLSTSPPTWTTISGGAGTPSGRAYMAACWFPPLNGVLVFGGSVGTGSGNVKNETFLYSFDTHSWTQLTPAYSPPARVYSRLAYIPSEQAAVLLWGGSYEGVYDSTDPPLNDQYIFFGGNWSAAPQPTGDTTANGLVGHGSGYDTVRERIVSCGGKIYGGGADSDQIFDSYLFDPSRKKISRVISTGGNAYDPWQGPGGLPGLIISFPTPELLQTGDSVFLYHSHQSNGPPSDKVGPYDFCSTAGWTKIIELLRRYTTDWNTPGLTVWKSTWPPYGVHANYAGNSGSNNFPGPFHNPYSASNLIVSFGADWDGGDVTVYGTYSGGNVSEVFAASPGSSVIGSQLFTTVSSAVKSLVGTNASAACIGSKQVQVYYKESHYTTWAWGLIAYRNLKSTPIFTANTVFPGTNVRPAKVSDGCAIPGPAIAFAFYGTDAFVGAPQATSDFGWCVTNRQLWDYYSQAAAGIDKYFHDDVDTGIAEMWRNDQYGPGTTDVWHSYFAVYADNACEFTPLHNKKLQVLVQFDRPMVRNAALENMATYTITPRSGGVATEVSAIEVAPETNPQWVKLTITEITGIEPENTYRLEVPDGVLQAVSGHFIEGAFVRKDFEAYPYERPYVIKVTPVSADCLELSFNEDMDMNPELHDPDSYEIDGGLVVRSAEAVAQNRVRLYVSPPMAKDQLYTITVVG